MQKLSSVKFAKSKELSNESIVKCKNCQMQNLPSAKNMQDEVKYFRNDTLQERAFAQCGKVDGRNSAR